MKFRSILVLAGLLVCQGIAARAAEIEGQVMKADGDRVEVRLRGQAVPQVGDPAEIFYVIPDAQIEASVARGKVAELRDDVVVVTIVNRTAAVQAGYSARILAEKQSRSPADPPRTTPRPETRPSQSDDSATQTAGLVHVRTFQGLTGAVYGATFSPDGKHCYACSLDQGLIQCWDVASGEQVFSAGHDKASCLAITPDGRQLVSAGEDRTIRCWDALNGRESQRLQDVDDCWGLAISPDGRRVVSGVGGDIAVWELAAGKLLYRRPTSEWSLYAFAFLPDGKSIVCGGSEVLVGCNAESGAKQQAFEEFGDWLRCLAISPDGRFAATGHSGTNGARVRLWKTDTGRVVHRFTDPRDAVLGVAFSPNGKHLLAGSSDGSLQLWDVATLAGIARVDSKLSILDLTFSPDGKGVLTTADGGRVDLWQLRGSDRPSHGAPGFGGEPTPTPAAEFVEPPSPGRIPLSAPAPESASPGPEPEPTPESASPGTAPAPAPPG